MIARGFMSFSRSAGCAGCRQYETSAMTCALLTVGIDLAFQPVKLLVGAQYEERDSEPDYQDYGKNRVQLVFFE